MGLSDCHEIMNPDCVVPGLYCIQCGVFSPYVEPVDFQTFFRAEFLFVAICTGRGVFQDL